MKKHLGVIWVLLFLEACGHNTPLWREWMFEHPPGGAARYLETYVKGWQDGCYTAGGATANHMYKFKFGYRQDEDLANNDKTYRKGWDDAYLYCTSYILQHNADWFGKRMF